MSSRTIESSPLLYARLAGVFFLLESLTAVFGQMFVFGGLVVQGDAAATAANILGNAHLFRVGFASSLLAVIFHIAWAALFYQLLKPVNRTISFLALLVILVGCALQALAGIFYIAPLLVLEAGNILNSFTMEQLQAMALVFAKLNVQTFNTYLVFFGLWCTLVGYLFAKSTFFPRPIGLFLVLAGLGYMTFLSAPLANFLNPYNLVSAAPGEISLLIWLLAKGVNVEKWKEAACS